MNGRPRTGWILGLAALLGALGALALFPGAWNCVRAQVSLALGLRPGWMRATTRRPDGGLDARLRRVISAHPDDVRLQIGAATLPPPVLLSADMDSDTQRALQRASVLRIGTFLAEVARRFPNDASVRAHQLRFMAGHTVWIRRPEEAQVTGRTESMRGPSGQVLPSSEALQAFDAVAVVGERLEPANGFFATMRAAGAFAAHRDSEALRYLRQAATKPCWHDYAGEATLDQWALLELAYGSRGWLQKLLGAQHHFSGYAPYMLVHVTARLALWHAWQREQAGDTDAVRAIRGDLMRLGAHIRDGAREDGQRLGLSLFREGSGRVPLDQGPSTEQSYRKIRIGLRAGYISYLQAHGMTGEAKWVQAEGQRVDAWGDRIDEASRVRQDRSHAQDMWLGIGWTVGLTLLRQIVSLLLLWAFALLLTRFLGRPGATARSSRAASLPIYFAFFVAPFALVMRIGPDHDWSRSLDAGFAALLLVLLGAVWLLAHLQKNSDGSARGTAVGLSLAFFLGVFLTPLVLIAMFAPIYLMWGYLGGLVMIALLALAQRAGQRLEGGERPLLWRPGLVSSISVLTSLLAFLLVPRQTVEAGGVQYVLWVFRPTSDGGDVASVLSLLALLPASLLVFLQLCRVAALGQPLWPGLARGLRRTIPLAVAMLAVAYLAILVPTVSAERSIDRLITQAVAGKIE